MTTPSLGLSPNPVLPGATTNVTGSAFDPTKRVQLAVNGAGWATNYFRPATDGTFRVSVPVGDALGTRTVQARYKGNPKVIVATASVVVAAAPPVTPPAAGSWFGLDDPWSVAFGTWPLAASGQLWISGNQGGRIISGLTFRNRPAGVNVIVLDGVSNLTIADLDFDTVPEGIYMNLCTDVTIRRLRARNIFGPFTRTDFHSGNLVQMNRCSRITLEDLKVVQPATMPTGYSAASYGTEDILSLGGAPGTWGDVTVQRFAFDGGAYKSPSGTGIFVGDGASGHDVIIRKGILKDPGQCAIGTGEEGPYTIQDVDVKATRNANAALQVRSNDTSIGGTRVDWMGGAAVAFGGTPTPATTYTDLGGNDLDATLTPVITL